MGQSQIDEDSRLNYGNEENRQQEALFHDGDDEEDSQDGHGVDHLEVVGRGGDHVLHAGRLADQKPRLIIFFQYIVELDHLGIHAVAGHVILGVNQEQFPLVAFHQILDGIRQDLLRDTAAQHGFETQDVFDAVHFLHFLTHLADLFCRQVPVHQNHMGGSNIKVIFQLAVGDHERHVVRQALTHVIIDFVVGLVVAAAGGHDENGENDEGHRPELHQAF